ncbi:CDP-diacylglycerol--glycerol-3-phosphate 3-phosphatidyltransferase [Candidatus Saganbacteria bacterium]|nr:CDP-diacylglycerol--glycerol-3-phosphate 3-phosphatidyltransferase [Candidatus Saganbacteria bacterium]
MNLPNLLTVLRIVLIPLIISLLYQNLGLWAAIIFSIASLLDALDGYIARKLNMVTDFGKLMDPIADKILVISVLIVLTEKGLAPALPVVLITARELLISGWRSHKAITGGVISASIGGKIKTVIQIIAVLMLILKLQYAEIVLWIAVLMSLYSGVEYIGRRGKTSRG